MIRPASAPPLLLLLALALPAFFAGCSSNAADAVGDTAPPTLVFLVRHAEKLTDGDDPGLSPAGVARAAELAHVLERAGVSAIYTSTYRRTKDTAAPLADRLGVAIQELAPHDTDGLVAKLREHPGETVLVVGHSNTVPNIIEALGARAVPLSDGDYDGLFLVHAFPSGAGRMTHLAFGERSN